MGLWIPSEARINNEAELAAAVAVMRFLRANRSELLTRGMSTGLIIKGDSQLAIGMIAGGYRPGKPSFWLKVKEVKQCARELGCPVFLLQVQRGENEVADWLAQQARKL